MHSHHFDIKARVDKKGEVNMANKFCSECGEKLLDNVKFCRSCGTKVISNLQISEISTIESSKTESPVLETTNAEVTKIETNEVETPTVESTNAEVPTVESTNGKVPTVKIAKEDAPKVKITKQDFSVDENPNASLLVKETFEEISFVTPIKTLRFSSQVVEYNYLKLIFQNSAEQNKTEFLDFYRENIKNLPDLCGIAVEFLVGKILESVDIGISVVAKYGFTSNREDFFRLGKNFLDYEKHITKIVESAIQLDNRAMESKINREKRLVGTIARSIVGDERSKNPLLSSKDLAKYNKSRVTDVVSTGIFNLVGGFIDEIKVDSVLSKGRDTFSETVYTCSFNVLKIVMYIFEQNDVLKTPDFRYTEELVKVGEDIAQNSSSDPSKYRQIILKNTLEGIEINPYSHELYFALYFTYPKYRSKSVEMAKYFGVEKSLKNFIFEGKESKLVELYKVMYKHDKKYLFASGCSHTSYVSNERTIFSTSVKDTTKKKSFFSSSTPEEQEISRYARFPNTLLEKGSGVIGISASKSHPPLVVALKSNRMVVTGETGLLDLEVLKSKKWQNIVDVSVGHDRVVGLRGNGTVATAQILRNDGIDLTKQFEIINQWENVIAISAGFLHTVALLYDGTVVSTQLEQDDVNNCGQCEVSDWTDIVAIEAGAQHTVGLKSDGTVVSIGYSECCDTSHWCNIKRISAGGWFTIGIKEDSTLIATGLNSKQQCDVDDWKDIVAISLGNKHTIGLKSNGKFIATGDNGFNQCGVESWKL